nr:MAG TPA: hypothetical protein [Caudoviricetes sp.]
MTGFLGRFSKLFYVNFSRARIIYYIKPFK